LKNANGWFFQIFYNFFRFLTKFSEHYYSKKDSMKILKYILIAILVLVILFFAMGIFYTSVNYGYEITVDKPLKEAWAIVQDESKNDQWLEGFQSMELIEGEKGKEGSKYKVIVNPGEGQSDFEMIETLVSIKEFEQVEMHFDSDMMDFEQIISFSESDGKTMVKTDSKVIGKGIIMRSMFAIMEVIGGSFTTQEKKNIEALKKVIEENTTDYYPALDETSSAEPEE
jgi:hypothetical protein